MSANKEEKGEEKEEHSPEYEFATGTTLHGLNKIADAPNWGVRLVWICIFLGCFGYSSYLVTETLLAYFSYDTITDVSLKFEESLDFPAVTFCNFNKYAYRKVANNPRINKYLEPLYAFPKEWSLIGPGVYKNDGPTPTPTPTPFYYDLAGITEYAGFQLIDGLVDCSWRGEPCTLKNFTQTLSQFGNCYVFNGDPEKESLKQTVSGSGNGLHLVINVLADEYSEDPRHGGSSDVGVKIHVHPRGEPAKMDTQGIAIGPGTHAYVGISKINYQNEIPPWGKCEAKELKHYDTYTLTGCLLECRAHWVETMCNCTAMELPGNLDICGPQIVVNCVTSVYNLIIRGRLPCECPTPCELGTYGKSVSYAGWPNPGAAASPSLSLKSEEFLERNYCVFDVFFKALNSKTIVQKRAMTEEDLLSAIGGSLGLFIGASIITVAEIGEYLITRPFKFFWKKK
ncbi:ASIC3 [Branchiostoma lanceolatum]|uniref:ASIC3 protein n=1 Tax=Branchiostoma lanceolatum TaxID=7740 RepID=A0A8J9ZGQ4_BRALA|nr:ASIC3 [Branchiostoma lanceolatum]